MSTVNKAILIGRLGKDPEVRYLANETAVVSFSIATDHKRKDQEQSETTWHTVVYFGRTAESVGKRAKKGDQVFAEGRMTQRKYTDRAGAEHRVFEVTADRVLLLSGKPEPVEEENTKKTALDAAKEAASRNIKQPAFDDSDDVPF